MDSQSPRSPQISSVDSDWGSEEKRYYFLLYKDVRWRAISLKRTPIKLAGVIDLSPEKWPLPYLYVDVVNNSNLFFGDWFISKTGSPINLKEFFLNASYLYLGNKKPKKGEQVSNLQTFPIDIELPNGKYIKKYVW